MKRGIRAARGLSRVETVLGVVAVVIVVVAAIGLSGEWGRAVAPPVVRSTPEVSVTPTPVASSVELYFEPGSVTLPAGTESSVAPLVTSLRADASLSAMISGYHASGPSAKRDISLARERVAAVRHALEADGVPGEHLVVETVDASASGVLRTGAASAASAMASDAERVRIQLR